MKTQLTRWFAYVAAVAFFSTVSTSAFALFDAQLLVGKRWYELKPDGGEASGIDGQQIYLGAHLDPIPLVPVAFGLGVNSVSLDTSDIAGVDFDSISVLEAGVEIMAWIPMVPVVTPYAKVNFPVYSVYAAKGKIDLGSGPVDYVAAGTMSGYHLNVGGKFSILPLVSLLVEVGMGSETIAFEKIETGDTTDEDVKDTEAPSQTVMIGFEVGF